MPLLEAMPLVWCAVVIFALLFLVFGRKNFSIIVASAVALTSSIAGISPWLQVVLWCAVGLLFHMFFVLYTHPKRVGGRCALVISRTHDGREGMVLYHGGYHTASPGCQFALMPPCGEIVQIFICDDGHCIICPQ